MRFEVNSLRRDAEPNCCCRGVPGGLLTEVHLIRSSYSDRERWDIFGENEVHSFGLS